MSDEHKTLQQLAGFIGAELDGDPDCLIHGLNTIQTAAQGDLAFLANPNYQKYLTSSKASAVILKPNMAQAYSGNKLLVDNPYLAYAKLTALFVNVQPPSLYIHPTAVVHAQAIVAAGVSIGAHAVIESGCEINAGAVIGAGCYLGEDTRIGANTHLYPNVSVYHGVAIGQQSILHSGCVIGADGFGFAPDPEQGGWIKIHQLGAVVIGDNVEIGACTTIDRGALGDTIISDGVILDNQVQIAHNVYIGENSAIAACTGIAGSTHIGRNCTISGACGLVGHLNIVDGVHITAMTLVTKSISRAGTYSSGTGMSESSVWRKNAVRFGQLNTMASRISALEKLAKDQD